jgi:hypothetical protein
MSPRAIVRRGGKVQGCYGSAAYASASSVPSLSFPAPAKALASKIASRTPVAARQNLNSDQRIPPPIQCKDSTQNIPQKPLRSKRGTPIVRRGVNSPLRAGMVGTVLAGKKNAFVLPLRAGFLCRHPRPSKGWNLSKNGFSLRGGGDPVEGSAKGVPGGQAGDGLAGTANP